jgi:hypothetical protein
MTVPRPLNLIWRRSILDGVLEAQFLRSVVLSKLPRPARWIAIEDNEPLPGMDDLLICSFSDCGEVLRDLRAAGHRNIGVLHLGDERGNDDLSFYADADYVLRHYHRAQLPTSGGHCRAIAWLPNGWAAGVGPVEPTQHLNFHERRHEIFFAGHAGTGEHPLPDRNAMLDTLKQFGRPAMVILTEGFGKGLGTAAYASYLGDTKFALAPAGNAPETIRFYDALECGALPVVTQSSWLHDTNGIAALGPPPVVTLDHWRDLTAVGAATFDEEQRRQAVDWWQRIKDLTATRATDIIEAAFAA